MGIKIIVPALGHEIISDHFRPIHRSRLSAEDYVWSAYSGVGHYIFEQCRYLSEEIKRVKNTWQYILRIAQDVMLAMYDNSPDSIAGLKKFSLTKKQSILGSYLYDPVNVFNIVVPVNLV